MIGIVCSRADEASEHITEQLLDLGEWTEHVDEEVPDGEGGGTYYRTDGAELRFFDDLHLSIERAADPFGEIDWLAFASRHSGDTGPLLTAHVTGNFGAAEYGGIDGGLAQAAPAATSAIVDAFAEYAPPEYDVGIECTHHGPSEVGVPSMFVELGSGPEEWADKDGARAVAQAILDARDAPAHAPDEHDTRRHLVGIGGGHYAPRFTRILRETDWHVGHVAADWSLEELGDPEANREVLEAAFERSAADYAVLEGTHPEVASVVDSLGYRIVGERWVRETSGIDLALVEYAEQRCCSIADGLRFGAPAKEIKVDDTDDSEAGETNDSADLAELIVTDLPTAIIDEARAIDDEETRAVVERHAVAFETEQSGTRIGTRGVFASEAARCALVDDLVDVLKRRYEVEAGEEAIRITESAFDPELASERGVPEGPKFGKLSNGQSVTVDGEEIDPADVTGERTRELPRR